VKWDEIDTCAKEWIKEAGERIKESFENILDIQIKSNPNDFVTNIDKDTEQFFIAKIKNQFPTHRILGEEGLGDQLSELSGIVWIIDPIDGTTNFIQQQRNFAISIGIYEDGIGRIGLIYDVVHGELYHATKGKGAFLNNKPLEKLEKVAVSEAIIGLNTIWVLDNRRINPTVLTPLVQKVRGTRSYGSAAIEIANVVAGRLDAYINLRLSPWDFAAGIVLLEEVGGIARTLRGEPLNLLQQNTVFFSKPGLYDTVMREFLHDGKW
jgi:myo-inositol-1(or 4)-monophosphatase